MHSKEITLPSLEDAISLAVAATVIDMKRQGRSKAYICEQSFEIEDTARSTVARSNSFVEKDLPNPPMEPR
jgi:hypothetical protein